MCDFSPEIAIGSPEMGSCRSWLLRWPDTPISKGEPWTGDEPLGSLFGTEEGNEFPPTVGKADNYREGSFEAARP